MTAMQLFCATVWEGMIRLQAPVIPHVSEAIWALFKPALCSSGGGRCVMRHLHKETLELLFKLTAKRATKRYLKQR